MTPPSPDVLPPLRPVPRPSRALVMWSALCASLALAAVSSFAPVMWIVAFAMRPQAFRGSPPPGEVHTLQQAVIVQVWEIVIASFLVLCVLTLLAVIVGRRALRQVGTVVASTRMAQQATIILVGCLLGGVLDYLSTRIPLPLSSLNTIIGIVLLLLIPAGVMASFLLSVISVRNSDNGMQSYDQPQPQGRGWRIAAWIDLTLSLLLLLAWAALVGFAAAFIAGFYLHIVY